MGPTSVILRKFRIMVTKQNVRGGWSGVAIGVQRSRVPLVITNNNKFLKHSFLNKWNILKYSLFFLRNNFCDLEEIIFENFNISENII